MKRKMDLIGTALAITGLILACVALSCYMANVWIGLLVWGMLQTFFGLLICKSAASREDDHDGSV